MLTDALKEAIDPKDLPSDPKEIKELARRVVNECIKSQNTKATDIKEALQYGIK